MKSIEEMAHDYVCIAISNGFLLDDIDNIVNGCFKLAEAMQAEAEKRKDKSHPDFK